MSDTVYRNTAFAERLDFEQELDRLDETSAPTMEQQEHQRFVKDCRKAGIPYTRLKKYMAEVDRQTADIKKSTAALQDTIHKLEVSIRLHYRVKQNRPALEKARRELEALQQQHAAVIHRLSLQYFDSPKKS